MFRVFVFASLLAVGLPPARAADWLDKAAVVSNRQWLEARLAALTNTFGQQPRAVFMLNAQGGVDVNLFYTSTRLLMRPEKEREELLRVYVFEPAQKGLNDILRTMPAAGGLERPSLAPVYYIHFLRTEAQQYVRVAAGEPGSLGWDAGAIKGFERDLQGTDFPQGSLMARYELNEAQWLSVQLAVFSMQKSDRRTDVRCVVSKDRKVACRINALVDKPKGGQAKEYYARKREEIGRRVTTMNEDLDRLFALEAREVRFNARQQLEWEINFDEGEGAFTAGRFKEGALTWNN